MNNKYILCIIVAVALVVTWSIYSVSINTAEIITNRTDEYGRAGKTILEMEKPYKNPNWKFTHCTPTTMDCGRRE